MKMTLMTAMRMMDVRLWDSDIVLTTSSECTSSLFGTPLHPLFPSTPVPIDCDYIHNKYYTGGDVDEMLMCCG